MGQLLPNPALEPYSLPPLCRNGQPQTPGSHYFYFQTTNECMSSKITLEGNFRFWFCFYLPDTLTSYLFFEKLIYANSVWLSFLFKISSAPRFRTNSFLMLLSDRMPVSRVNMRPGLGKLVGLPWMLFTCVSPPVRCHELIWLKQWALLKQGRQDSNSSFLFYLLASLPPAFTSESVEVLGKHRNF